MRLEALNAVLGQSDLAFANLECSLAYDVYSGEPFRVRPSTFGILGAAGFTHLHLANNHTLEAGEKGLEETLASLAEAGIKALGAGATRESAARLHVDEIGDLSVGWLACGRTLIRQSGDGPGLWELDEDELCAAVRAFAPEIDVLVVSIHAGFMLVEYPSPELRALAHRLCDAGAHLILMHHPHVLQGIEVLEDRKVICFSLGNLLFDWREGRFPAEVMVDEQNEGALFLFDLDKKGVASVSLVPTYIEDRTRVRLAEGERAETIVARVRRLSRELQGDYLPLFERQRAEHNTGLALRTLWHHLKRGELVAALRLASRARPHHLKMFVRWLAQSKRSATRP